MYDTQPAPTTRWSPFLPLLLLGASLLLLSIVLIQEMSKSRDGLQDQVDSLKAQLPLGQHQQFVAKLKEDLQSNVPSIEKAQQVQGALQKLAIDMVRASKDDPQIAELVKKYGIQVQEPAPAPAPSSPAPTPAPAQ